MTRVRLLAMGAAAAALLLAGCDWQSRNPPDPPAPVSQAPATSVPAEGSAEPSSAMGGPAAPGGPPSAAPVATAPIDTSPAPSGASPSTSATATLTMPAAAAPSAQTDSLPAMDAGASTEGPPGKVPAQAASKPADTITSAPPLGAASGAATGASAAKPVAAREQGDAEGARLLAGRPLMIPVQGIAPEALVDTYEQARGSRKHEAIDILAPRGTPVFAVDDGRLVKLFTSVPGGLTIYQFDPQERIAYYYSHLDRYAEGLKEGMLLRKGDLVGYVGSTGNADPAAPHLHFAIFRLGPERQWWKGEPVNPYPALRQGTPAPTVAARAAR